MAEALQDESARAAAAERSRELTRQANALREKHKWEEALPVCVAAHQADPSSPAAAYNLGVMLSKMGRLEEGEKLVRHALTLAPDEPRIRHSLSHILLGQGRYQEAWPLYESRRDMPELNIGFPTGFDFPRWHGESLAGKRLAIFPEQGLGDMIQFARFLPRLIDEAAEVVLLTVPALERLFRHNFPGATVVRASGNVDFPDPDYWTTFQAIPAAIDLALADVPAAPYIHAPFSAPALGDGFRIGLKAIGNPTHVNDAMRSLPPAMAARLQAGLPGRVISLEPQALGARDMADTAAVIDQLDLVVTVDTSIGHLAGAMGKRCLLLLPGFSTDWRWMVDRADSPWYPNHVLYRSAVSGDWSKVVERVIMDADPAHARLIYKTGHKGAEEAEDYLRRAFPDNADPTLEPALRRQAGKKLMREALKQRLSGRPLEGLRAIERAVAVDPDNVDVAYTQGVFLADCGRLADGEAVMRRVIAAAPELANPRDALGNNLLAQGRYHEAWPLYEARVEREGLNDGYPRTFPFPRWQGEDLKGKCIAIFPEQGLGDQIQFVRFVPRLEELGARVVLLASPPLAELFRHNLPQAEVVVAAGSVDFPDPDYWATLADLPVRLDVQTDSLWNGAYLKAPHTGEKAPRGTFRVGLMVQGNPSYSNDAYRSLPAEFAVRLRRELPGDVVDLSPASTGAKDFAGTAVIVETLDLVVSVDTSVAHLAGAMGKRCLLLVPGFGTDWRWMRDRADSPWYPNHCIYRGAISGDWSEAVEQLIADADPACARDYSSGQNGADETERLLRNLFSAHANPAMEPALRRQAAKRMMAEAEALHAAAKPLEALEASQRAVALDPDSVNAAFMHGVFLTNCGRLEEGEAVMRRVIQAAPDLPNPRDALGNNLLAQGRYSEGWPLYEAHVERSRQNDSYSRAFPFPRWRGEDLDGKCIAIFPEQGIGDQIQFVRFVPRLEKLGARVILMAPPALVALFQHNFPQVEVVTAEGSVDFPDPDYWATLADLAVRMDVQPDRLWDGAYLKPSRAEGDHEPGAFRVGLMVQGNPEYRNDIYRSLPAECAARLRRELPGQVVDLSPAATGARDFDDTAAIIDTLDIVVSVDTAVAHLAGAMGKSCLLLLPGYSTDWRWMRGRRDSPWYSHHVLYRTEAEGGWDRVIDQVVHDVRNASQSAFRYLRQASAFRALGRYSEALAAGRKALAAEPDHVGALHNMGRLLTDLGRLNEAEKLQRRAMALSSEDMYRYGLSLNLLAQGRYAEAWPLYEARTRIALLKTAFPHGLKFPRWRGEDLSGKRIAIFPEQGFGDQMQFARFLPQLRERGAEVVLLTPPALVRLFEQAFPDFTIVKAAGAATFPKSDVWTSIVELGHLLDVRLETLPRPELIDLEPTRAPGGGLRVGFMGKGNPAYVHDAHRSLPREAADRLRAALPGEVVDLDPKISGAKDFLDTAHIVANLDLVVSVDTSVGHLSGIIGKPCALLIPGFATDWRWLRDRSDSPWYPNHRLFRGGVDGNWDAAMAELLGYVESFPA